MLKRPANKVLQNGQALVETALILPILLLIVVGIVDLGRAYYSYLQLTNAASEGARYAASNPGDTAGAKSAAESAASDSGVSISDGDIDVSSDTTPGQLKVVTIHIDFPLISLYIFNAGTIRLENSASMMILPGAGS